MSPAWSVLASPSITVWVIVPAGTITHTIRGVDNFSASSATEYTPVVLSSLANALTARRVVVVDDTLVSARGHPTDDVRAHPAQADHP